MSIIGVLRGVSWCFPRTQCSPSWWGPLTNYPLNSYSRGHHEPHPGYAFDESLLNIPGTNLMANELAVNDLTVEQLKTK